MRFAVLLCVVAVTFLSYCESTRVLLQASRILTKNKKTCSVDTNAKIKHVTFTSLRAGAGGREQIEASPTYELGSSNLGILSTYQGG
jgi:hypothetical protein